MLLSFNFPPYTIGSPGLRLVHCSLAYLHLCPVRAAFYHAFFMNVLYTHRVPLGNSLPAEHFLFFGRVAGLREGRRNAVDDN